MPGIQHGANNMLPLRTVFVQTDIMPRMLVGDIERVVDEVGRRWWASKCIEKTTANTHSSQCNVTAPIVVAFP